MCRVRSWSLNHLRVTVVSRRAPPSGRLGHTSSCGTSCSQTRRAWRAWAWGACVACGVRRAAGGVWRAACGVRRVSCGAVRLSRGGVAYGLCVCCHDLAGMTSRAWVCVVCACCVCVCVLCVRGVCACCVCVACVRVAVTPCCHDAHDVHDVLCRSVRTTPPVTQPLASPFILPHGVSLVTHATHGGDDDGNNCVGRGASIVAMPRAQLDEWSDQASHDVMMTSGPIGRGMVS